PLMQAVLADLALDWLGSLALVMRVARAFDGRSAEDRAFARLSVALAKYWTNKRCPGVTYEAMECLGGAGYVEECPMPMLYREAPLNSIWEGSGNVICLDVLRSLAKAPEGAEALAAELSARRGEDRRFDAALEDALARLARPQEAQARMLTERLALLLQASELMRGGEPAAAEGFLATRLAGEWGRTAGTLPEGTDAARIAELI
ncbi:MAG: acyl-CoA dehydrogenase family protein, partial [Pseudomonadota bacterium]